jgi:hypothetical protein
MMSVLLGPFFVCVCRLGVWDVTSTLTAVELPMGSDMLPPPNKRAVQRAEQEDLNKPMRYQVCMWMTLPLEWFLLPLPSPAQQPTLALQCCRLNGSSAA